MHMLLICLSRIDGYTKKGYDVVECKGRTGVGLMAVSYTHLDVYKRQECDKPLGHSV